LPACLLHAGDLALIGQLAEANTANTELAKVGMGPSADLAAVVLAGGELCLSLLLQFHRSLGHNNPSLFRKRGAHERQQLAGLLVGVSSGYKADVHTADLVDLVILDKVRGMDICFVT